MTGDRRGGHSVAAAAFNFDFDFDFASTGADMTMFSHRILRDRGWIGESTLIVR